jgi:hypothetical protein
MTDMNHILAEWHDEKLAELRYLRACIHAWAGGDMPGTEAMRNFRELDATLKAQQAGYQEWRRTTPSSRPSVVFKWPWPAEPK